MGQVSRGDEIAVPGLLCDEQEVDRVLFELLC